MYGEVTRGIPPARCSIPYTCNRSHRDIGCLGAIVRSNDWRSLRYLEKTRRGKIVTLGNILAKQTLESSGNT